MTVMVLPESVAVSVLFTVVSTMVYVPPLTDQVPDWGLGVMDVPVAVQVPLLCAVIVRPPDTGVPLTAVRFQVPTIGSVVVVEFGQALSSRIMSPTITNEKRVSDLFIPAPPFAQLVKVGARRGSRCWS